MKTSLIDAQAFNISVLTNELARYQWQPIETAPKDGTEILLCSAVIHDIGLCYWSDKMNGWTWGAGNYFRGASYWMPLTLPPTIDKQGE